jgi:hypothetical protein
MRSIRSAACCLPTLDALRLVRILVETAPACDTEPPLIDVLVQQLRSVNSGSVTSPGVRRAAHPEPPASSVAPSPVVRCLRVSDYPEGSMNTHRRHFPLGQVRPAEFEEVRLGEEGAA